jgi:hypothetical protein
MGFGTSPAGAFPFGYGAPASAAEPPNGAAGTRYINPGSRDYEVDPDTRQFKQMPALRQRVLLKLATRKDSIPVLRDFGLGMPSKMGTGFERALAERIRVAFRQETDVEKVMRIDAVIVQRVSSGRAHVIFDYTDLSTGEPDRVTV